ncbi:MAG: glycosyltransferase family 39 protein [Pseudolabrys sp.]|jgi:4-amino-4-deoxy-L-arabinose transferase-like glycosyltransferase
MWSTLTSTAQTAARRTRASFTDPANAGLLVLVALAIYVMAWTGYGTITKAAQGLNPDMTELIAWSRDLDFGYSKHPPLAAWLVRAWFEFMPVADWSYYLLAMLMPALALWIVWRLTAEYLPLHKRVAALALLTLIPFFNFHALKFNVNTVLMPLWAAATYFFLRAYVTRSPRASLLAGIAAAACMLGKYWSIFLLAGLVVAALADKRRAAYFRSPAPWITVVIGAICLSPHIVWLVQHDFITFKYASAAHEARPFVATAIAALGYLAGSLGYVALPAIIVLVAARANVATLRDIAWPRDPDRRLVALAFWAPLLLPMAGALIAHTEITSLWSMSAWTLLPVLLLSPPGVAWRPVDTGRVVGFAVLLPVAMLIAAPFVASKTRPKGPPPAAAQAPLLAREVERLWHTVVPFPLRFIGGDGDIVLPVATYASERPRILIPGLVTLPDPVTLRHAGMVQLCFAEHAACAARAKAEIGDAPSQTSQTTIVQTPGHPGAAPRRYTIMVVPPRP